MLVFKRRPEQAIRIGDDVCVRILSTDRRETKIGIDAPPHVRIDREEVFLQRLRAHVTVIATRDDTKKIPPGVGLAFAGPHPCSHSVSATAYLDPVAQTIHVSVGTTCSLLTPVCDVLARAVQPNGRLAVQTNDVEAIAARVPCGVCQSHGCCQSAREAISQAIRGALEFSDPNGSPRLPHALKVLQPGPGGNGRPGGSQRRATA